MGIASFLVIKKLTGGEGENLANEKKGLEIKREEYEVEEEEEEEMKRHKTRRSGLGRK